MFTLNFLRRTAHNDQRIMIKRDENLHASITIKHDDNEIN